MKKIILERGEDYDLSVAGEDEPLPPASRLDVWRLAWSIGVALIAVGVVSLFALVAAGAEPQVTATYSKRYETPPQMKYKPSTEPRWDLVPQIERLRIQCVPSRSALLSGNNVAGAVLELVLIKNRTREQQAALNMLRKRLTPEDRVQLQKWRLQAVNAAKQANKVQANRVVVR